MKVKWTTEDSRLVREGTLIGASRAHPESRNSFWQLLVLLPDGNIVTVSTKVFPCETAKKLTVYPD